MGWNKEGTRYQGAMHEFYPVHIRDGIPDCEKRPGAIYSLDIVPPTLKQYIEDCQIAKMYVGLFCGDCSTELIGDLDYGEGSNPNCDDAIAVSFTCPQCNRVWRRTRR
uniref:Uncharacterized protein n=1 Tax=viral metagenome TaxID=1070528 RepID=A0A6M3KBT4_9ZZZZ